MMPEKQPTTKPYGRIYLITNIANGKVYVGQTIHPIEKRWYKHCLDAARGVKYCLHQAIKKYGADGFIVSELSVAYSMEELDRQEKKFIAERRSCERAFGYNLSQGGQRPGPVGEETRDKHRYARNGKCPTAGRPISAHRLEAIRKAWREGRHAKGFHMSDETKAKPSAANSGRKTREYGPASPETRRKMSVGIRASYASMSKEERAEKFGAYLRGNKRDPEIGRKISEAKRRNNALRPPKPPKEPPPPKDQTAAIARRAKIIALRQSGIMWKDIAAELGVTAPSVHHTYYKFSGDTPGLRKNHHAPSFETKAKQSDSMKQHFLSMTPEQRANVNACRIGEKKPWFAAISRARFETPENIDRRNNIVAMRDSGAMWKDVGRAFGVSPATVREIYKRIKGDS